MMTAPNITDYLGGALAFLMLAAPMALILTLLACAPVMSDESAPARRDAPVANFPAPTAPDLVYEWRPESDPPFRLVEATREVPVIIRQTVEVPVTVVVERVVGVPMPTDAPTPPEVVEAAFIALPASGAPGDMVRLYWPTLPDDLDSPLLLMDGVAVAGAEGCALGLCAGEAGGFRVPERAAPGERLLEVRGERRIYAARFTVTEADP